MPSYYESSARERIQLFLDPDSFSEFLPPTERLTSPHLEKLNTPSSFDDGVIIGQGLLNQKEVYIAAQEGGFMGGAVGEVHGAKLVGLLEKALDRKPHAVFLLIESGGVRLHEANAGLIAISEIMRAILKLRKTAIPVIVLDGGQFGCFGGMGIVARLCDVIIMSEEGRLGLSGPEVIETSKGVEEFDSRDKALVWRTVGGKHRYILGEADYLVKDDMTDFRRQAIEIMSKKSDLTLQSLKKEQAMLTARIDQLGTCRDAIDIWKKLNIPDAEILPLMDIETFLLKTLSRRAQ